MNDRNNNLVTDSFLSSNTAEAGQADAALRILKHLLRNFPGTTGVRLLADNHIEVSTPQFTLLIKDTVVLRRLIFSRSPLPLADAYINGLIDVEGDLYAALGLKQYFQFFDFSLAVRWALLRDAWRWECRLAAEHHPILYIPRITPVAAAQAASEFAAI